MHADELPPGVAYAAEHVLAGTARRNLMRDGTLVIVDGDVVLTRPGDGPIEERILAAAPVTEVEVLAKPWYCLGQAIKVRFGDSELLVQPETVTQGTGLATPKKMRRAREAVTAFESALERVRAAAAPAVR